MRRRTLRTVLTIALAGAVACSSMVPVAAEAATPRASKSKAPKTERVPAELFGMNASGERTGAKALRLWDAGVTWAELQPTNGPVNWGPLDAIVNRARANGYKNILYVFGSTPSWAASGGPVTSYPSNDSYYLDYVAQVARRYKGKIKAYQTWNEADLPDFYTGSPESLAKLTAKTYKVIKKIDRKAMVAAAGLVPRPGRFGRGSFEDRYLSTLRKEGWPTDAFIVSMYPENENPSLRLKYTNIARKALKRQKAPTKQLWESEANYASSSLQPFPDATQMRLVARTYIDSMAYGLDRVYWYSWTQDWAPLGVRMTVDGIPTPAATAYRTVESWMSGKRWAGCTKKKGVTQCPMTGGQRATIMYTDSSSRSVSAPKGAKAVCDLYNSCTPTKAGTRITVTSSPVLVKGA